MQMNYLKTYQASANVHVHYFELPSHAQTDNVFTAGQDLKNGMQILAELCRKRFEYNFVMPIKSGPYAFDKDKKELASSLDIVDCEYFYTSMAAYLNSKNDSRRSPLDVDSMAGLGQAAGRLAFENYASQYYDLNEINISAYGIANAGDPIGSDLACQFVLERGRQDLRKNKPAAFVGQLLTPEIDRFKTEMEEYTQCLSGALDNFFGNKSEKTQPKTEPHTHPGLSGIFETFRLGYKTMTGRQLDPRTLVYTDPQSVILLGVEPGQRILIPGN